MKQTIYYICEIEAQKFHFFEKSSDADKKVDELVEKYGYLKNPSGVGMGISEHLDKLMETIPKYQMQRKELKKYYGTVWLAYKWDEKNTCVFIISDHYKNIEDRKQNGYSIQKFELTPYKEHIRGDY